MSEWNHVICAACWIEMNPTREPVTLKRLEKKHCCFCGEPTYTGIYVRGNSEKIMCRGKGGIHAMHIGFTGTQQGMTDHQKKQVRKVLEDLYKIGGKNIFHHGDCIGADSDAHDIAANIGYYIVVHPPIKSSKRAYRTSICCEVRDKKDYLVRNRDIVDESDFMIATPSTKKEILRSGTWSTVRYTRNYGSKGLVIIDPE